MENREQQILSEIKSMMASIRTQLEQLDAKMAELQQVVDPQDIDLGPIDLEIVEAPAVETVAEPAVETVAEPDDDLPFDFEPEPVAAAEPEPETEPVEEPEPVVDSEPDDLPPASDDDDDDLPIFAEPETVAAVLPKPRPSVIDSMTDKQAWRTDMPGTPVKDIRSAISLNDRIFFINYLFNEDPMAFQEALTRINQMSSLDEVVAYAVAEHPDWNMESDVVYRFMMAVRRRIR